MRSADYGNAYDNLPEIRQMCLNCKYKDCVGHDGCKERQEIIMRIKGIEQEASVTCHDIFEINGVKKTLREWCREKGVYPQTIEKRLRRGLPWPEVLDMPNGKGVHNGQIIAIDGEKHAKYTWIALLHTTMPTVQKIAKSHGTTIEEAIAIIKRRRENDS